MGFIPYLLLKGKGKQLASVKEESYEYRGNFEKQRNRKKTRFFPIFLFLDNPIPEEAFLAANLANAPDPAGPASNPFLIGGGFEGLIRRIRRTPICRRIV